MVKINSIIEIPKPLNKFLNKFSNIFDKRTFNNFKIYVAGLFLELKRVNISAIVEKTTNFHYENVQYVVSEVNWVSEEVNNERKNIIGYGKASFKYK